MTLNLRKSLVGAQWYIDGILPTYISVDSSGRGGNGRVMAKQAARNCHQYQRSADPMGRDVPEPAYERAHAGHHTRCLTDMSRRRCSGGVGVELPQGHTWEEFLLG